MYEPGQATPGREVEKGLWQSLSRLAQAHGFMPLQVSEQPYPYNILLSYWYAREIISAEAKDTRLWIDLKENGEAVFAATDTVDTGTTLYYIPVVPLYKMLQDRSTRQAAELLLSVCSYLYRAAGVPYYRDGDAYLNWHYEMLAEWVAEGAGDIDREDYYSQITALNKAAYYGDIMGKRIYHSRQLDCFAERINTFSPRSTRDEDCLKIARAAFDLWQQYPGGHLLGHAPVDNGGDEYEEPQVRIYEYVSFIAETEGSLYETLSEMVNNEFNERTQLDEPTVTIHYDGGEATNGNLDYERRLFDVINDLCELLNDLP